MTICTDTGKAFIMKILDELGTEGSFVNLIKDICQSRELTSHLAWDQPRVSTYTSVTWAAFRCYCFWALVQSHSVTLSWVGAQTRAYLKALPVTSSQGWGQLKRRVPPTFCQQELPKMWSCGKLLQPDGEAPPKENGSPTERQARPFCGTTIHIKLMRSLEKLCELSPVLYMLEIFL